MRILKHLIFLNLIVVNLLSQTKLNDSSIGSWESAKCEKLREQTTFECINLETKEAFHIVTSHKEILLVNSTSNKVVEKYKLKDFSTSTSTNKEIERIQWIQFKTKINPSLIGYSYKIGNPLRYLIPIYNKDKFSRYVMILFISKDNSMSACN